jgi:hypothetical protein
MYRNGNKNKWFPTLIDLKIPENAFFTQNCLERHTVKTFYYLRRYEVIPFKVSGVIYALCHPDYC